MTTTNDDIKEAARRWAAKVQLAQVLKGIASYHGVDVEWKTWDDNIIEITREGESTKIILRVEIV